MVRFSDEGFLRACRRFNHGPVEPTVEPVEVPGASRTPANLRDIIDSESDSDDGGFGGKGEP
jgi:hypothetical protein